MVKSTNPNKDVVIPTPIAMSYDSSLPESLYTYQLFKNFELSKNEAPIYKMSTGGYCDKPELVKIISDRLGVVMLAQSSTIKKSNEPVSSHSTWKLKDTVVHLACYTSEKEFNLEAASFSNSILEALFAAVNEVVSTRPPSSNIMVLASSPNGLQLSSIGEVKSPLKRINYPAETLLQYDHIKECLQTNDPCGRLILLSGAPGTGKSYMIRGLATEVEALFFLIPTNMAGELTGPTILPLILQHKEENTPVIILIEDADMYLAKQSRTTNPGGISDILNLGDGLFGEMADIRIVATSNATTLDIDPAILRPGRLCSHTQVEKLTPAQANACYKDLTGKDFVGNLALTGTPLSDIYKMARESGWKPTPSEEFRAGDYL